MTRLSKFKYRVVGGLLSAYDLSSDKVFLEKAKDIADRLLPAWNTSTGIPYNIINLAHGNAHNPGWTGVSSLFIYFLLLLLCKYCCFGGDILSLCCIFSFFFFHFSYLLFFPLSLF